MARPLPDFVIIGATKAATTWLTENLRAHPGVFMPSSELHYFSRNLDQGDDWYRAHFAAAGEGLVIGEKSASYLPHPEAPARLQALLPAARLIAQLRNPIERAYSDYCMHYRRGEVGRRIERYFDPAATPIPRLLQDGLYHRHLSAWLERFPAAQLEIVLYDDIRREPAAVFQRICAHVGLDRDAGSDLLGQRIKNKNTAMVPPLAKRMLAPLKGVVQPFRDHAAFRFARSLLARQIDYPRLTPALRQRLADYFRADIAALGDLLGRDLSHWLVEHEQRRGSAPAQLAQSSPGVSAT
jgi:hypothetical protein